ncbi:acyl-CoA N-acyltransferase [Mycena vulgaris]|nr:acyl-CoA N-acyltransferase [Mycena vulgaris]
MRDIVVASALVAFTTYTILSILQYTGFWSREQDPTIDTKYPRSAYYPSSPSDVFQVRRILVDFLPPELVNIIIDDAKYWPRLACARGPAWVSASSTPDNNAALRCLVTPAFDVGGPGTHLRVKSVRFEIASRDQGWGGEPENHGTYNGSYTWFEAAILRPGKAPEPLGWRRWAVALGCRRFRPSRPLIQVQNPSEPDGCWRVQTNRCASRQTIHHTVLWEDIPKADESESNGSGDGAGFLETLAPGDRIGVVARAMSTTMPHPDDPNFCFPIPHQLETDRVKLVPFVPSEHADAFIAAVRGHDEVFAYLPWGPFASADDLLTTLVLGRIQPDRGSVLFAVLDKTAPGAPQLAGTIGFLDTSPANRSTEIGFVITLPRFQRTHVTSGAVGLLLRFALEGLGLRRVAWKANAWNARSVRAAERMGFRQEAVLRWDRVLPAWKTEGGNGGGVREGDPRTGCLGRDTVVLSLCWDDWEGGACEAVDAIIERRA